MCTTVQLDLSLDLRERRQGNCNIRRSIIKHSMHKSYNIITIQQLASLEVYVLVLVLGEEAVSHCGPASQTVVENKQTNKQIKLCWLSLNIFSANKQMM